MESGMIMESSKRAGSSKRIASLVVAAAAFVAAESGARADLAKGQDALTHGDYKLAERSFEETTGAEAGRARLGLARVKQALGDYKSAEQIARALTSGKDLDLALDASVLLAEIERQTGRYAQARDLLLQGLKVNPKSHALRHALGLSYEALGQVSEAEAQWNLFFDEFAAQTIDLNNAEEMFYVAEAARHLYSFEDANESYQEAVEIDKNFHVANITWAELFMEKYAPGEAEQSLSEVLKINPRHPDALADMAALRVGESYDIEASLGFVDKALKVNPKHVPALLVRASIEIDRNEWDKAKDTAREALKVNPESYEARATLATIFWLLDDMKAYEAERDRVLKLNPHYSRFFHVVMRSAEREHRYHAGVELGEEAVRINDRDYEAMQLIGSGYLRLGQEKLGIDWLRKAYRGDQFNQRTLNTLDLFEKIIPRDYELTKSKTFNIRYHKDERPVYERYITPVMEQAYADMVKRYGFTPSSPLTIELYQNADHYSVRTIGLPNLGALGVCFGQVVTAMSPSVGNLNWGMVLWHELSHVFAIQLSDYRVPRWFTEGLSEYETIRARPEWRRENDSDLWAAVADNTLPSVTELNYAFMKPSMQAVVVAYHLSSVTIEYIVAEYGFPKIVEALKLFAKGKETKEVIEAITGKSVATFDKEFRAHLMRRLAPYQGSFHLPGEGLDDVKALAKIAKANAGSAEAQARLALGQFYAGEAEAAAEAADAALKIDPGNGIALFISAELAMQARDAKKAKSLYEELIRQGGDSFDVRSRLAMIAANDKDEKAMIAHLQTAKALDPERSYPYQTLADYYESHGKTDLALQELETYVMIEQMDLAPITKLVEAYSKKSLWHKVVHYAELGLFIDPGNGPLQLALAQAYLKTGKNKEALFAYDTALLIRPQLRRPAQAHLGRAQALLAMGDKKQAKRAVMDALDLEPDNADALKLDAGL